MEAGRKVGEDLEGVREDEEARARVDVLLDEALRETQVVEATGTLASQVMMKRPVAANASMPPERTQNRRK